MCACTMYLPFCEDAWIDLELCMWIIHMQMICQLVHRHNLKLQLIAHSAAGLVYTYMRM